MGDSPRLSSVTATRRQEVDGSPVTESSMWPYLDLLLRSDVAVRRIDVRHVECATSRRSCLSRLLEARRLASSRERVMPLGRRGARSDVSWVQPP